MDLNFDARNDLKPIASPLFLPPPSPPITLCGEGWVLEIEIGAQIQGWEWFDPKSEMERVKIRQDAGAETPWKNRTIPEAVWGGFSKEFAPGKLGQIAP